MIIDLLNFCRHSSGAEASILFRLQESGIRVPSFFCLTEDFIEDELNSYLQNHFQHTTHFIVRLSLSYEDASGDDITLPEYEPPHYINIQKSIIVRYAERLFTEARGYIEKHYPGKSIAAHVIVQEMINSTIFGGMQTACRDGALNETMITIGIGHDTDFVERGIPFSIYCHNDTDNILFSYEADGAMTAEPSLIEELLRISDKLKVMFSNCHLTTKFLADYDAKKLYFISVQKIADLNDGGENEILLDTRGVCNYYPGITKPLHASIAMMLSRQIIYETFSRIGYNESVEPELMEQLAYVNGRLYFNKKRLERLQQLASFHENTEEFVNRSARLLWKHILKRQRIEEWRMRRNIAVKLHALLKKNVSKRDEICARLKEQLQEYSEAGSGTNHTDQSIHNMFDSIIASLSDCMCSNLFNTLYINMNRRHLERQKPGSRKYMRTLADIKQASDFRKELRFYHGKFMMLLNEYGLRTGEAFVSIGAFEKAEDIFMLTYEETLALKEGQLENTEKLISDRHRDFEWYASLPGFSSLVFHNKIQSAPAGVVHFLDVVKSSCYIRGSGINPGYAKLPVIVCEDSVLPEKCSSEYIYAVKKLPEKIPAVSVGGLIIESSGAVFAAVPSGFPVICGAEHICTLASRGCTSAEADGKTGEVRLYFDRK